MRFLTISIGIFLISPVLQAVDKPNFILINVDDLGWTDLGCFGSKIYETPNIDDLADYVRELWSKTTDDDFLNYKSNRPRKKSSALHISRCTGDLFRQMQDHKIKAKEQIEFVISIYSDFKYFDFADEDIDGSKFRRVEKQRERSLVKHK